MTQRKKMVRKSLRSKSTRHNRKSILNAANLHTIDGNYFNDISARRLRSHGPSIQHNNTSNQSMDVEFGSSSDIVTSTDMDIVPPLLEAHGDEDIDMLNMLGRIFAMADMSRKVFANRTKPVKTHPGAKRIGAKQAKKLEISESGSYELSPADATMYRALAARCNYLAQDRPDIAYSAKELCREFAVPNQQSFKKLKRLCRYLAGLPRLQYEYLWQEMPLEVTVFVDTDFAGCKETRRSTSGGAAMLGNCLIKHWSKTQTTISLSSGEAELHGNRSRLCAGSRIAEFTKRCRMDYPSSCSLRRDRRHWHRSQKRSR
jgi:hypothetical protein